MGQFKLILLSEQQEIGSPRRKIYYFVRWLDRGYNSRESQVLLTVRRQCILLMTREIDNVILCMDIDAFAFNYNLTVW